MDDVLKSGASLTPDDTAECGKARARPSGRPREFCTELALDRATDVFWRKGYEGTTLPDLTAAMKINRPSLYAAFGNKEQLFRRCVERYAAGRAAASGAALSMPTGRASVEAFLRLAVDAGGGTEPRGCLLVRAALACGTSAETVRLDLVRRRAAVERVLRDRLHTAVTTGELSSTTQADDLARFYATVLDGLAVRASGGSAADDLLRVIDAAMRAWPAGS